MPYLIRNTVTQAEYEVASFSDFVRVYGDNPEWVIQIPADEEVIFVDEDLVDVVVDDNEEEGDEELDD